MYALECRNLSKSYDRTRKVIDCLNIQIPQGRIVGLLGPNGCGKSTLMKLITGLLTPTGGDILVYGQPISEKTNAMISYLPEKTYFNPNMTVTELMELFADFYADYDAERTKVLLRELAIDEKSRLRTLSKGTQEKVQLIMAMSRRAKLYLLDEPIGGVDPASREYILNTIISNYDPEATVIITTHLISEIETVLDEFMFIGFGGGVVRVGNADEVRASEGKSLDELFREEFRCSVNY